MKNRTRAGQSAIGLLVSAFLIVAAVAFFFAPRGGEKKTTLKRSMDMAENVGGVSYLSQIQQGIDQIKSDNDGKAPASLEELKKALKDYPPECWVNPVDKKPFVYDPVAGKICAEGPGCPATGSAPAAPAVAGANPAPPGVAPAAPAAPAGNTGPGGIRMNIPQPGAGAAEAMRDN